MTDISDLAALAFIQDRNVQKEQFDEANEFQEELAHSIQSLRFDPLGAPLKSNSKKPSQYTAGNSGIVGE